MEEQRLKRQIRLLVALLFVMAVIIGCANLEKIDKPDCVNSYTFNSDYWLTIIANRKEIDDKEAFAKELIEQVRNNDFHTIMFSYDEVGYPTNLRMTVYLNQNDKKNNKVFMSITFKQENITDGYNIVEDYDKFTLEIDSGNGLFRY